MAKTAAPESPTERAQAPIRWPRPDGIGIVLILVWLVGVVFALPIPGLIVSPGSLKAPTEDVVWALVSTAAGTLVMMVSSYILYRRTREVGFAILGAVPAMSCLAMGIVLAATKLTGTGSGIN
jgi:hypothetical protein